MSSGSNPYQVSRPTRQCASTGRAIESGERYIATLVEIPGEEDFSRMDFCESAWIAGARPASPNMLFGFWRSVLDDDTRPERPLLDDDELIDLFEQLSETEDPKRLAFRYLLALALIRKRLLTYEGGQPANIRAGTPGLMRVRRRGQEAGEVSTVIDPGMTVEAIDAATELIGQIMTLEAAEPGRRGGGV